MLKNLKYKIKKKIEIFSLISLVIITAISTSYFNYKKSNNKKIYNNFVDNIYFKKTLNEIINNLEPKYKKIKHKIKSGETFDKILESYSIDKKEINKIKNSLKKNVNIKIVKNPIVFGLFLSPRPAQHPTKWPPKTLA